MSNRRGYVGFFSAIKKPVSLKALIQKLIPVMARNLATRARFLTLDVPGGQ